MPMLGFQAQFALLVESGEKRQTIRKFRKDGRDPKVGDTLYLYTGLRQKGARKLGEATCIGADKILMARSGTNNAIHHLFGSPFFMNELATRDGFKHVTAMFDWFDNAHGLPFEGLLIRWGDLAPLPPMRIR